MANIRETFREIKNQNPQGDKMTLREYVDYTVATFGFDSMGVMSGGYLMLFYTAIGIDVAVAGGIVAVTKMWDAINDPICATVIDNCNSKNGKFKRFLAPLVPFLAILSLLLFVEPPTENMHLKIAICSIVYILWETVNTFCSISFQSMQAVMSSDLNERSNYITFGKFGSEIAKILPGLIPVLFDISRNYMQESTFYTYCALFFCSIGCIAALSSRKLRERVVTPKKKQNILHNFTVFFKNKQMLLLWSGNLANIVSSIGWTASSFFFIYSVGSFSVQTLVWMVTGVPMFIVMMLSPVLLKRFKPRHIVIFNNLIGAACLIGLYLSGMAVGYAGKLGIALIIAFNFISSIPAGVAGIAQNICFINTFDYTEWKTGDRAEATSFVVTGILNKGVGAIGAALAGILLKAVGFVDIEGVVLSQYTKDSLFFFYTVCQAIGLVLSTIPYFFYKVEGPLLEKIKAELDERHALVRGEKDEEVTEN